MDQCELYGRAAVEALIVAIIHQGERAADKLCEIAAVTPQQAIEICHRDAVRAQLRAPRLGMSGVPLASDQVFSKLPNGRACRCSSCGASINILPCMRCIQRSDRARKYISEKDLEGLLRGLKNLL